MPAAFTTFQNGKIPELRACICGGTHLFKECYYLNLDLRPQSWAGEDFVYKNINEALADPKKVKIKTLVSKTTKYDGGIEEISKNKQQKMLFSRNMKWKNYMHRVETIR